MSKEKLNRFVQKTKSDIALAYNIGYSKGWDDAYRIPNRFGAKFVASYGYKKGIRDRLRHDKYIARYNKGKQE